MSIASLFSLKPNLFRPESRALRPGEGESRTLVSANATPTKTAQLTRAPPSSLDNSRPSRREGEVPVSMISILKDERGALLTIELILVATIVGLGSIAGLAAFRDSVSQEFGDVSAGLASIDHGYTFNDLEKNESIDNVQFAFFHSGSNYVDESNFCEPATLDPTNDSPMCMEFSAASIHDEGDAL